MSQTPWYKEGLSFECTECGGCCQGSPGYIWVSESEIQAIAQKLQIPLKQFVQKYIRKIGNRYSLKELPQEQYKCIFLKGKRCQIYDVRPKQCRTYPYWPSLLKSRDSWEQEKKTCEGIREGAKRVSLEEILKKGEF